MNTHPASNTEIFKYLETVVNGAAPLAAGDFDRLCEKAKVK